MLEAVVPRPTLNTYIDGETYAALPVDMSVESTSVYEPFSKSIYNDLFNFYS